MYFSSPMDLWSVTNSQAGATQPTASKAAGAAGVQWVAKRAFVNVAAGATVQPALQFNLRNGATGAGTVVCSWQVALGLITALSGVNCVNIDADNLNFVGSSATAMTLEATGAPVANTTSSVTLQGYAFGLKPIPLPVLVG